jgi:predicted ATPase
LLFRHGVPPHATYVFKHVLIRDAAYSTLLRSRRHDLHRQIVSVLQREFPELVVSQPELLAHHCAEAGMIAEAIEYCLLAAQRATAASNNTEKIAHIARGIALVEQLSSSDQRAADFRIRLTLGGAGFLW